MGSQLVRHLRGRRALPVPARPRVTFSAPRRTISTRYAAVTHPDGPPCPEVAELLHRSARCALVPYARPSLIVSRGKGCKLWDSEGREYLDLTAGIAVNALGHADEGVARVVADQAKALIHCSNLFHNPHAGELAVLLVQQTRRHGGLGFSPGSDDPGTGETSQLKVFLANSGSEANEGALKMARKHGKAVGQGREKSGLVCFTDGFHGRTLGSLSVTHQPKYQEPFAPLIPGVTAGRLNDVESVLQLVTDETCGVIVEPIQGEGGILEADEAFLRALRRRCDEVKAVLIYDEIQCGLGRTGALWAHSRLPVDCHPDVVTMAKPLANGIPIGAILMRDSVANVIKPGDHGTTFGGGALQTAVARHVLQRLSDVALLEHVQQVGGHLRKRLERLAARFGDLAHEHVRGRGLILGLPFRREDLPAKVVKDCRERGVLLLTCGNQTVRFVPSLTISTAEVDHACDVLESVLSLHSQA